MVSRKWRLLLTIPSLESGGFPLQFRPLKGEVRRGLSNTYLVRCLFSLPTGEPTVVGEGKNNWSGRGFSLSGEVWRGLCVLRFLCALCDFGAKRRKNHIYTFRLSNVYILSPD
jgi:hypothetical protein